MNSTAYDGVIGDQIGCTVIAALVVNNAVFVANAGDCRCVIGKNDGSAVALSNDHIALEPQQRVGIEARGGFVSVSEQAQAVLMVSRAFGDHKYKRFISATPEVISHHIVDDDGFLILASE